MRRTRFMSVLFLMLSGAFFFVPQFRQAFTIPTLLAESDSGPASKLTVISAPLLQQWARDAEAKRDARTLAFVALRLPDARECARLADLAVSIDPKLGWVYFSLISNRNDRKNTDTLAWAKKLQQFDPENALGYLQEAEYLRENNSVLKAGFSPVKPDTAQRLEQKDWRSAMEKAFAAPRYDSYNIRRFELERTFMREHNIGTPAHMIGSIISYPIPNLLNVREYAILIVNYLGKDAEKAGHTKEALDHYWNVAHFSEHMQLGADNLIEQLIATAIQKIAYTPLATLLRKTGQSDAAATIEFAAADSARRTDALRGKDVLAMSSNFVWNALIATILTGLVMVFTALTAISVLYVNAKRWFRVYVQGKTYATVTIAENYLPVLLFVFCMGLYISYYPYARNFQHYMTATGEMHDLESVFQHTIALPFVVPGKQISLGNPFVPYIWYATGGIAFALGMMLLGWFMRKPEAAKGPATGTT